jgi:hypothetical protein
MVLSSMRIWKMKAVQCTRVAGGIAIMRARHDAAKEHSPLMTLINAEKTELTTDLH